MHIITIMKLLKDFHTLLIKYIKVVLYYFKFKLLLQKDTKAITINPTCQ